MKQTNGNMKKILLNYNVVQFNKEQMQTRAKQKKNKQTIY